MNLIQLFRRITKMQSLASQYQPLLEEANKAQTDLASLKARELRLQSDIAALRDWAKAIGQ